MTRIGLLAALFVSLAPLAASAQPSSGPMTIERLHSGFLAGADVKLTEVDHRTSELVGGHVGWVMDDALFVGGAGYWLANNSRDREMAYGGLVVQWLARPKSRVGYAAKGLIGGGQATLSETITQLIPPRIDVDLRGLPTGRIDLDQVIRNVTTTRTLDVPFRQGFFVAEPEANVFVRVNSRMRLMAGVGYRLVSAAGRGRDWDDRLRGATGTLSLQIS